MACFYKTLSGFIGIYGGRRQHGETFRQIDTGIEFGAEKIEQRALPLQRQGEISD